MAKQKDVHWNGKISAKDFEIPDEIFAAVQKMGEDVLRSHIETDIYGVDQRVENGWCRPVVGGLEGQTESATYERRHELPSTVYSEREGDVVYVNAYGEANTPLFGYGVFTSVQPGSFLELLERGNLGFLTQRTRYAPSFPRPALSNAQAEVDSKPFKDKIQKLFDDYYR